MRSADIAAALCLMLSSLHANAGDSPCVSTQNKFKQVTTEAAGDFNPVALLQSHGLEAEKFSFTYEGTVDRRMLNAFYDGKSAGYMITAAGMGDHGSYPIVEKVEVQDAFKGKGLGTVLYTAVAHKTFIDGEGLLTRSELVSSDAVKFWSRLVKLGYAETIESEYGEMTRMKRDVVEENAGKTGWEFVKARFK